MHLRLACAAVTSAVLAVFSVRGQETADAFFTEAARKTAETTSVRSDFLQTKKLKAFRKPLVITGELCMDRTGRFAWHVKAPIRYSCVIADGTLSQWDADTGKTMTLDVGSNPGLRYLVRSLTGYFSGDFQEMRKDFEPVRFDGNGHWGEMVPKKDVPAARFIRSIRFTFTDGTLSVLKEVRICEVSGDETTVEFRDPVCNQPIPEEKWRPEQQ